MKRPSNNTVPAKTIISLGYPDWWKTLMWFRDTFKQTAIELGIGGRDTFIREERNAEVLKERLGVKWGSVQPATINQIIAVCTRTPEKWGGGWKITNSKNHGKRKGHRTRLNAANSPSAARQRLRHKSWIPLRDRALIRDGHRCRLCNKPESLEVHHSSYDNLYKPNEIDDLITLCKPCHELITVKQHYPTQTDKFVKKHIQALRQGKLRF